MPEFFSKKLFTINGMTLTVGALVVILVIGYGFVYIKNR